MIGAVALHAAMDTLSGVGWPAISAHEHRIATSMRRGLAAIPGVRLLGPGATRQRFRSPPSRWRQSRTPWWRRGWRPSMRSE